MNDTRNFETGNRDRTLSDKNDGSPAATGTGAALGAAAGGVAGAMAAGAAVGGMTGPVGAVVGAVVGALAGGVIARTTADPVEEESYWRDNYSTRPYVTPGSSFDDYAPAYRHGVEATTRYPDRRFDEVESDLGRDWSTRRGNSSLEWDRAKHAARDAWERVSDKVERAIPGDSDRDGR